MNVCFCKVHGCRISNMKHEQKLRESTFHAAFDPIYARIRSPINSSLRCEEVTCLLQVTVEQPWSRPGSKGSFSTGEWPEASWTWFRSFETPILAAAGPAVTAGRCVMRQPDAPPRQWPLAAKSILRAIRTALDHLTHFQQHHTMEALIIRPNYNHFSRGSLLTCACEFSEMQHRSNQNYILSLRQSRSFSPSGQILTSPNKKLLGAPGIATRSKDATRGSSPYY